MNSEIRSNVNWRENTKLLAQEIVRGSRFKRRPNIPYNRSHFVCGDVEQAPEAWHSHFFIVWRHWSYGYQLYGMGHRSTWTGTQLFSVPICFTFMVIEWQHAFRKRKFWLYLMCDVNLMQLTTASGYLSCVCVCPQSANHGCLSAVTHIVAYRLPWGCVSDSTPRPGSLTTNLAYFCFILLSITARFVVTQVYFL
jgi:hypothetical protein